MNDLVELIAICAIEEAGELKLDSLRTIPATIKAAKLTHDSYVKRNFKAVEVRFCSILRVSVFEENAETFFKNNWHNCVTLEQLVKSL